MTISIIDSDKIILSLEIKINSFMQPHYNERASMQFKGGNWGRYKVESGERKKRKWDKENGYDQDKEREKQSLRAWGKKLSKNTF